MPLRRSLSASHAQAPPPSGGGFYRGYGNYYDEFRRRKTGMPPDPTPPRNDRNPNGGRGGGGAATPFTLAGEGLVLGLLAVIGVLLAAQVPQIGDRLRTILTLGASAGALVLLASVRDFAENMRVALRRGPNPLLLALVAWSVVCFFIAAFPAATFRSVAAAELLRVVSGAAIFLTVAYGLPRARQILILLMGLLGLGVVIALFDYVQIGQASGLKEQIQKSVFGTHENVGSLLVLLLPVSLALALGADTGDKPRIAAQAVALILGGALLLARTRSAWLGAVFALVALCILLIRFALRDNARSDQRGGRSGGSLASRLVGSPVVIVAIGFAILITLSGVAPLLISRATTLTGGPQAVLEDGNFQNRLNKWAGGARMAAEKPIMGWGLGMYPMIQGRYTHDGYDTSEVLVGGVGHENIAHNYYVQWASETGAVGLALHIALVGSFLAAVLRGLSRASPSPYGRTLAVASYATILGASVDAIAAPSYNFHSISAVYFAIMGLGIAALRPLAARTGDAVAEAIPRPTSPLSWISALAFGALGGLTVVGIGNKLMEPGKTLPRGELRLIAAHYEPLLPGQSVLFRLFYHQPNGKVIYTMPGALWNVDAEPLVLQNARVDITKVKLFNDTSTIPRFDAALRLRQIPATNKPITVSASWRDQFGRTYTASSTVRVATAKSGGAGAVKPPKGVR